jgi:T5SS/PEP-CTERM-associated repeat protein
MLRAQVVADGATNTLSNVATNFTGDVTVGTTGSFTLLILSDNVLLTNSANGVIGRNTSAKSNEVRLISASARWRMGGSLFVGSNGAMSLLVVSNGALVENTDGALARTAASSNNFILVTGGGSVWSNRNQLDIGGSGPGNQMVVSNGGWVASVTGVLGRDTRSSNNLVRVTGSGSVWSNSADLFVGNLLPGNRLVIEAGGLVSSDEGYVGVLHRPRREFQPADREQRGRRHESCRQRGWQLQRRQ